MLVDHTRLTQTIRAIFEAVGVSAEHAAITADALIAADLRGIDSHGVARLDWYIEGIKKGTIDPKATPVIDRETPATAALDAQNGLGQVASVEAMRLAITKAKTVGIGMVTVRRSNHHGISAHYALQAEAAGLIGVVMTNSKPLVVPTGGTLPLLGTNPLAVAIPTATRRPFVVDMATSNVPVGRIEVAARRGETLPEGWAVDASGQPASDPQAVLDSLKDKTGGGLMPMASHKGYAIGFLIDILSGVLAGAAFSDFVGRNPSEPPNVGHTFIAIDPTCFGGEEFRTRMDTACAHIVDSPRADGVERIYVPGEIEFERADERRTNGIPLDESVYAQVKKYAAEFDVASEIEK